MTITLTHGDQSALVSPVGAELRAWNVKGQDLLWPGDPAWWDRSAPILFPIVGWARDGRIRVDDVERAMGVHGFAAGKTFAVVEQDAASCTLTLADDVETRAAYPFAFRLAVTHRLTDDSLVTDLVVTNPGDRPLPYAFGVHPGFRWPLTGPKRTGHRVVFAEREETTVPVIAPGGLFSPERRTVAFDGRALPLDDALFAHEALCFLHARSRAWRLESPGGALRMDVDGLPHLALWSKPGAPFVCLEAWSGHGDPVGFTGEMQEKPSMRLLAPGATDRARVSLAFTPA
jgi:galactose mutarotase-like enzyme